MLTRIYLDAGLRRGSMDAISLNECLPIVSLSTLAKDKRVFGVIGDTEPADRGTRTVLS
jgi:hypothetical protein